MSLPLAALIAFLILSIPLLIESLASVHTGSGLLAL